MSRRGSNDQSKQTLSRTAYDALLERLLNNKLVPGEILNRRDLAAELGMSVAPVLEAVVQLEMEGFLESIARKGTQVRPIRTEDVFGMLVIREALECQAARMYCGEPVRNRLDELRPLAKELEQSNPEQPEYWKNEIVFHRALVDLANCSRLSEEFQRCMHLNVFYAIHKLTMTSVGLNHRRHDRLLDELLVPDPDHAERVVREHVRSGKGSLVARLA